MIKESDRPILRHFIERESMMFPQHLQDEEGRLQFVQRMFDEIVELRPNETFNYVHIQSITNCGLMDSELVLSASPWAPGLSIYLLLPPSPRGNIGFAKASSYVIKDIKSITLSAQQEKRK